MQQYKKILGKVMMTAEGAYNSNKEYDPISLVTDEETGKSYISRQEVPVGTQINNREYWQPIASSGIIDNGVIILNRKNSDGQVSIYDLKSATEAVAIGDRKGGVILGFLGFNPETDTAPTWKLYQYNDVSPSNWTNIDYWLPMDYTNKYAGWFDNEKALYDSVPFPKVGMYAYVGNSVLNAVIYRCYNDRVWQPTEDKAFSGVVNLADEEDITSKQNKLKFKDKEYNPAQYNGLGRIYLRKNIIDGKNILMQDMMQATNTIYIIQYDYDLQGQTITVPENCTFDFQGGSFNNGTIVGNETIIRDTLSKIFGLDITIQGTFNVDFARPEWFGAKSDNATDCTEAIQIVLDVFDIVKFSIGTYITTGALIARKCNTIMGCNTNQMYSSSIIKYNQERSTVLLSCENSGTPYISISDICFIGPDPTVENAVYKEGVIGIDITSGNNVRLSNVWIKNFEYIIYSNYNSYYNKFENCRFENAKYVLYHFSTNNLVVNNCKFLYFDSAILVNGDGPLSVIGNSFEVFSGNIIYFLYNCEQATFMNNYIELYDSYKLPALFPNNNNGYFGGNNLFYGKISRFTSIGNEFQVNGAFRIYWFETVTNFVSIGNHFYIIDGDCNVDGYTVINNSPKLSNFVALDSLDKRANTSEDIRYGRTYISSSSIGPTFNNTYNIIGTDPFNGFNFLSVNQYIGMSPNKTGGWWIDDTDPILVGRINNGYFIKGRIVRRKDLSSEASDYLVTLPDVPNVRKNRPHVLYFSCVNSNYDTVVISINVKTREVNLVKGSKDYDIYLDGITIYDMY